MATFVQLSADMRKLVTYFGLIICCVIVPFYALNGQEPIYEVFRKTDGLRDQNLFQCYQDSDQRLWIASDLGVMILDGQQIRVPDSENEMPEMAILKIREDRLGNLWFLTMNGNPVKFDGKAFKSQWGERFSQWIRGANYLSAFAAVEDGSVLFGTNDGRAFQLFPNGTHRFLFNEHYGGVHFIEVLDREHFVFHFSKVNVLGDWNKGVLRFRSFKPLLENWTYGTLRSTKLKNGKFLFGVENRIAIVEHSGDTMLKIKQFSIPEKNLIYVGQDVKDNIWLGTNEGAIKYNPTDSLFENPTRFLKDRFITSVCRDHEDGLWFTTDEGLYHCKNENILCSRNESNEIHDEATAIFLDRNGTIFLGFKSGKIQEISRKNFNILKEYPNTSEKSNPRIIRFQETMDGAVIAAGFGGLIQIKNGVRTVLADNKFADFSIQGDQACACLFNGWSIVKLNGNWEDSISTQLLDAQRSQSNRCLHSRFDNEGNLWVSTYSEVLLVNEDGIDTVFSLSMANQSFTNSCIQDASGDVLAFGTTNQGLFFFSKNGITRLEKSQGLIDNHIFEFATGAGDIGWVLTAQGLSKVSVSNKTPKVLFTLSKLNVFADKEVHGFLITNDTLWAAAGNGYVMFPIEEASQIQTPPKVRINRISVNNSPIELDGDILLEYNENNLRIQYNAITFSDPKLVEYRYRILGIIDSFQTTSSQTIDLPGLSPNSYVLEIEARHPFGSWGSDSSILKFQILAPLWKRPWFVFLEIVLLFLLVGFTVMLVLRNLKKRQDVRESLMEAKHNALISQMNPHFVFNSLNSIQNFVLNKNTELANSYLADFSSLMRAILVNGRSSTISVSEEVRFLELYLRLESLRLDDRFDYKLSVSKGIIAGSTLLPTMMLQPLLENSIWHGVANLQDRKGKIEVEFRQTAEFLVCTVSDNGIGRAKSAELAQRFGRKHQSLASTILLERIDLLNRYQFGQIEMTIEDLFDQDGEAAGTKVKLSIPLMISTEKKHD